MLRSLASVKEVENALKSIGDLKVPGVVALGKSSSKSIRVL